MKDVSALSEVGLGLRVPHLADIRRTPNDQLPWFEVIAENILSARSSLRQDVDEIAKRVPVALHCVSMNLGGIDPLDEHHIRKISHLAQALNPFIVSDHLCWTSHQGAHHHDLLPLLRTKRESARVGDRIKRVQDLLGRPLAIENVSSYVCYQDHEMSEAEFLGLIAELADCHLLLDMNNVVVSCHNQNTSSQAFMQQIPKERIRQCHLAGHTVGERLCVDDHGGPVSNEVLALWSELMNQGHLIPTLLEWDKNIPSWDTILRERTRIMKQLHSQPKTEHSTTGQQRRVQGHQQAGNVSMKHADELSKPIYEAFSAWLLGADERIKSHLRETGAGHMAEGLHVYRRNTLGNRRDALAAMFTGLKSQMGDNSFSRLCRSFVTEQPARSNSLDDYCQLFLEFTKESVAEGMDPLWGDLARLDWHWNQLDQRVEPVHRSQWELLQNPDLPPDDLQAIAQQICCLEIATKAATDWLKDIGSEIASHEESSWNPSKKSYLIMWRDQHHRRVAAVEPWFFQAIKDLQGVP